MVFFHDTSLRETRGCLGKPITLSNKVSVHTCRGGCSVAPCCSRWVGFAVQPNWVTGFAIRTCHYTYDNAGNLVEEQNPLGEIFYDYTYYRVLNKRYYMTFSRPGIVQTLRDLPSALDLSKTLLHDVFSPRHSANTAWFALCARLIENVIATWRETMWHTPTAPAALREGVPSISATAREAMNSRMTRWAMSQLRPVSSPAQQPRGAQPPSWWMFGSPLLFSLVWICSPAQQCNRICNLHNNLRCWIYNEASYGDYTIILCF